MFYLIIERYTRKYARNCDQNYQHDDSGNDENADEELQLPQLTAKNLRDLYSLVEFSHFNFDELEVVFSNELIPHDIITKSLMEKLKNYRSRSAYYFH